MIVARLFVGLPLQEVHLKHLESSAAAHYVQCVPGPYLQKFEWSEGVYLGKTVEAATTLTEIALLSENILSLLNKLELTSGSEALRLIPYTEEER